MKFTLYAAAALAQSYQFRASIAGQGGVGPAGVVISGQGFLVFDYGNNRNLGNEATFNLANTQLQYTAGNTFVQAQSFNSTPGSVAFFVGGTTGSTGFAVAGETLSYSGSTSFIGCRDASVPTLPYTIIFGARPAGQECLDIVIAALPVTGPSSASSSTVISSTTSALSPTGTTIDVNVNVTVSIGNYKPCATCELVPVHPCGLNGALRCYAFKECSVCQITYKVCPFDAVIVSTPPTPLPVCTVNCPAPVAVCTGVQCAAAQPVAPPASVVTQPTVAVTPVAVAPARPTIQQGSASKLTGSFALLAGIAALF